MNEHGNMWKRGRDISFPCCYSHTTNLDLKQSRLHSFNISGVQKSKIKVSAKLFLLRENLFFFLSGFLEVTCISGMWSFSPSSEHITLTSGVFVTSFLFFVWL